MYLSVLTAPVELVFMQPNFHRVNFQNFLFPKLCRDLVIENSGVCFVSFFHHPSCQRKLLQERERGNSASCLGQKHNELLLSYCQMLLAQFSSCSLLRKATTNNGNDCYTQLISTALHEVMIWNTNKRNHKTMTFHILLYFTIP